MKPNDAAAILLICLTIGAVLIDLALLVRLF